MKEFLTVAMLAAGIFALFIWMGGSGWWGGGSYQPTQNPNVVVTVAVSSADVSDRYYCAFSEFHIRSRSIDNAEMDKSAVAFCETKSAGECRAIGGSPFKYVARRPPGRGPFRKFCSSADTWLSLVLNQVGSK